MGETMMCRYGALSALRMAMGLSALAFSTSAICAELPQVKLAEGNKVPECATPGRLQAFIQERNKSVDEKFSTIAADYMRVGEELNIRWDMAFFQMLLETGNLAFTGDVAKSQNNFAGLGATGRKNPGETFADVPTGVKAHLQHLLMYAGEKVDEPVAERTRKVQEWGVLDKWHKSIDGPVTYSALAKQWAPGSKGYARDIETISDAFYSGLCRRDDPNPEMMALVHPTSKVAKAGSAKSKKTEVAAVAAEDSPPKISGADLARRAVEEARASGSFVRSSLGASSLVPSPQEVAEEAAPAVTEEKKPAAFKLINAEAEPEAPSASAAAAEAEAEAASEANTKAPASANAAANTKPSAPAATASAPSKERIQTAALGSGIKAAAGPAKAVEKAKADAAPGKCRVWTASYGGAHAVIIKAAADDTVNYTVLDVNETTAKREADAYIAAYAKGGQQVGEFSNQTQALDKAFELCPEG